MIVSVGAQLLGWVGQGRVGLCWVAPPPLGGVGGGYRRVGLCWVELHPSLRGGWRGYRGLGVWVGLG